MTSSDIAEFCRIDERRFEWRIKKERQRHKIIRVEPYHFTHEIDPEPYTLTDTDREPYATDFVASDMSRMLQLENIPGVTELLETTIDVLFDTNVIPDIKDRHIYGYRVLQEPAASGEWVEDKIGKSEPRQSQVIAEINGTVLRFAEYHEDEHDTRTNPAKGKKPKRPTADGAWD